MRMRHGRPALALLLALLTAPAAAEDFARELSAQFATGATAEATDDGALRLAAATRLYRARSMAPLWVTGDGAGARAAELAALLAAAEADALDPDDYGAAAVDALLGATRSDLLAELELRLSLGLMRLARDLGEGRVEPHVSDPNLYPMRDEIDPFEVLQSAAKASDLSAFVDGYRPQTPRYDRLKAALAHYRSLAAAGGWPSIAPGPALKPGMTDPRVAALRARLRLWGDLHEADDLSLAGGAADTYDDALAAAVRRMQHRHGLEEDGIVGAKTLGALNVPVETRVEQLVLNLERRRWMPDDLGKRYVFVNLADFYLKLIDEPETVFATRVIVGKPYHMSPVFSKNMTYIEVNPYWNVPHSIASKELLPKIKQDVGYLASNHFVVLSDWSGGAQVIDPATVDWSKLNRRNFRFKIRQQPGDDNALGRIKFMLPNRFNVYLHDTPAKGLFRKAERGFSHGCIRVENPMLLADLALRGLPEWTPERIAATVESGKRTIITLAEPLPVHVSYLTAWVNKDGSVHFRKDIYGRDAKLAESLLGSRATAIRPAMPRT